MPQENAEFAVTEIERRADDPAFVQIMISPRSSDPLGHRRYWPIYAAAERCGKPLALHVAGYSGGHPSTGSGWPTYYIQEHYAMVDGMQNTLASLVFEGVLERFPKLKIVMIEGGFAWMPALCWRMDKHWERMRAETPHLKRPPSEYVREHVWFTTQPIEEPENPEHLVDIIELDRLGPADVLDRLPALGLRRPAAGLQGAAHRRSRTPSVPGQRQGVLRPVMSRQVVARASEVAPGTCKIVTARGREIGLFNIGGEYFALSNRCPHKGAELCRGMIVGLPAVQRPGRLSFLARAGVHPLSLAWLGVRYPHRPIVVRSQIRQGAAVPGDGRARLAARSRGPTSPRRSRSRSRKTIWWSIAERRDAGASLPFSHGLCVQRKLGGAETALLRHRGLGAVADVGDQLASVGQLDIGAVDALHALGIDEEEVITAGAPPMSTYLRSSM